MDNLTPITREEMLMNDETLTPITREEKILAGEDLECVTRREYFLKKYRHAGGDVMVEGLEVTANGTYTAPDGKAYSPVEVAVPLPENAYLLKTASGSLVSFSDGADLPMPSFICNITANQDLHGYDAPWVGGAGKNKCPVILSDDASVTGYTATVENDGGIIVNGTWTGTNNNIIGISKQVKFNLPAGSYILSGTTVDNYNDYGISLQAYNWDTSQAIGNTSATGYAEFTLEAQAEVSVRIYISNSKASGKTIPSGGIKLYPMIRLSSISDASWEPYENICPISGHTGVDAWVRGKNLVDWKWNTFNDGKMEIFLKGGAYTISAESILPNSMNYIRGTKPSGEYLSREELGLIDWNTSTTSGIYYGGNSQQTCTFNVPNGGAKIEFGKLDTNGTISAQLEIGETATTYEPYNTNSQTIQVSWQTEAGEVFGGYVDLVSGVLTVTDGYVDLGTLSWIYDGDGVFRTIALNGSKLDGKSICSNYTQVTASWVNVTNGKYRIGPNAMRICDTNYTDATAFTTAMNGVQLVYELTTPITYQLTPTQIKSLLGNNNAWCDTGEVDADYFAKEV